MTNYYEPHTILYHITLYYIRRNAFRGFYATLWFFFFANKFHLKFHFFNKFLITI